MFAEAVEQYEVREIALDSDAAAVASLRRDVAATNIFLLGEQHGREETPCALYTLFRAIGFRALALEWEPVLAPVVTDFLASGRVDVPADVFPSFASGDGTLTAGHFALLARLRNERRLDQLILFDDTPTTFDGPWHERDARMAAYLIRERRPDLPTLVVTGGFHTVVDEQEGHPTLAVHVRAALGRVPTGRLSYDSRARPRFTRGPDATYVFELGDDSRGFVPALR